MRIEYPTADTAPTLYGLSRRVYGWDSEWLIQARNQSGTENQVKKSLIFFILWIIPIYTL